MASGGSGYDKPPPYNEATAVGALVPPAGSSSGYGAMGGVPAGYNTTGQQGPYNQHQGYKSPPTGVYSGGYQNYPAPGQVYGSPPGYVPVLPSNQPSYMQPQSATVLIQPQPSVVVVGGCPACRVGVLEDDFTCLGVCCAIFFFPLGVLCCLAMRQRRCPNCGAVFG